MYGIRHIVKGLVLWDAITWVGQTQEALTHKHTASIRQSVSLVSSLPLKIFLCVGGQISVAMGCTVMQPYMDVYVTEPPAPVPDGGCGHIGAHTQECSMPDGPSPGL